MDILHPANAGLVRTQPHHIADLSDVGINFFCAGASGSACGLAFVAGTPGHIYPLAGRGRYAI
jgi:hypothetical protein